MIKSLKDFQSNIRVRLICKKYGIENWSINSNGLVDIDGDVGIDNHGLDKIPIKFGHVRGDFDCYDNKLKSLEGLINS